MTQSEFDFRRKRQNAANSKRPPVDPLAGRILSVLQDGQWHTAADLRARLGVNDRRCRAVASGTVAILSGNDGYKLLTACTPAEFREANGRLISQARKMKARAIRQQRLYHRSGHVNGGAS